MPLNRYIDNENERSRSFYFLFHAVYERVLCDLCFLLGKPGGPKEIVECSMEFANFPIFVDMFD